MGFRRSPFPLISGTAGHETALNVNRELDKTNLPDGRSESAPLQENTSPAKTHVAGHAPSPAKGKKRAKPEPKPAGKPVDSSTGLSAAPFKPSPAKGYQAKASAYQQGVDTDIGVKIGKTDTAGKYFKSVGVEGKYPGAPK